MPKPIISLQYTPKKYFLKDVNPLAKFIALISLSAVLFISRSVWLHVGLFAFCVFLFIISPYSFVHLQGSKALIITTAFIGALQVIFTRTGEMLLDLGFLQVTLSGLVQAASASSRFITVILLSYLFILTTEPDDFVLSTVELGLPYRFGYTLMTAMRMIPVVRNEIKKISFAQITRGVSYKLFPPRHFFKNINKFLKVVLISTIKRVNQLVLSMEGRSFGLFSDRTYLHKTVYRWTDFAIITLAISLIPISIIWR